MQYGYESSCRAKARWKFLSQAITKCKNADTQDEVHSVRRFSGYDLFDIKRIYENNSDDFVWFQYSLKNHLDIKPMKIRFLQNATSVKELIGFNNTGNICVWPSEEVLSYYCLKHKDIFRSKSVCELGSGMTALAGIQVAGNTECSKVVLTDGNQNSIENINSIIQENKIHMEGKEVQSKILKWEDICSNMQNTYETFDIVLCADCLFFLEVQNDLLGTIKRIMKSDGLCIILAPRRSGTLEKFVELAQTFFVVHLEEKYDSNIWQLHEKSSSNKQYCSDLHFPLLIKLWHKENITLEYNMPT